MSVVGVVCCCLLLLRLACVARCGCSYLAAVVAVYCCCSLYDAVRCVLLMVKCCLLLGVLLLRCLLLLRVNCGYCVVCCWCLQALTDDAVVCRVLRLCLLLLVCVCCCC